MINIYNKHNLYSYYKVFNNIALETINRNNKDNKIYIDIGEANYIATISLTRIDKNGYSYTEHKSYSDNESIYIFEIPFDNKNYNRYYFSFSSINNEASIYINSYGFIKTNIDFIQDYNENFSFNIEYDLNNNKTNYSYSTSEFNFTLIFNREDISEVNNILSDEFYFDFILSCKNLSQLNKLIPTSSLNYEHLSTSFVKVNVSTIKG